MGDSECEPDGDCCVHGVAALPKDLDADIGCEGLLGPHHGVAGSNRLARG